MLVDDLAAGELFTLEPQVHRSHGPVAVAVGHVRPPFCDTRVYRDRIGKFLAERGGDRETLAVAVVHREPVPAHGMTVRRQRVSMRQPRRPTLLDPGIARSFIASNSGGVDSVLGVPRHRPAR